MTPNFDEWVEATTVGDAVQGLRRYLSLVPPFGRELVTDQKGNPIVANGATKTQPSNHRERKRATGVELTLLDDLDGVILKRDHEAGILGNLRGKLSDMQAAVDAKVTEIANLEMRAAKLRKAFEVLHGALSLDDIEAERSDPPEVDLATYHWTPREPAVPGPAHAATGDDPT